jgi:hypothetical protein
MLAVNTAAAVVCAVAHLAASVFGRLDFRFWHLGAGALSAVYAGGYLAALAARVPVEIWSRWEMPKTLAAWTLLVTPPAAVSIRSRRKGNP